ncbi:hypothetical protein [Rhizobium sp. FY34]|uniref:hypothetical protein n=1 Tax=Rhizobium sp. FY34 TaxID=2562309 RepID=UPI0010BFA2AE|nr:hypothetical protein [Rhizobium sp. FY34]
MKPMPFATSRQSHLKPRPYPFEELNVAGIIDDVERRVRVMCRMAQLYQFDDRPSGNDEGEIADLVAAMEVFYEFVDHQMDTLSALSESLADKGYVSLKKLERKDDD